MGPGCHPENLSLSLSPGEVIPGGRHHRSRAGRLSSVVSSSHVREMTRVTPAELLLGSELAADEATLKTFNTHSELTV